MINIEDAIKVAGMEGKMTAIDLTELVDQSSPGFSLPAGQPVEAAAGGLELRSNA
jgi:hypothetical protein